MPGFRGGPYGDYVAEALPWDSVTSPEGGSRAGALTLELEGQPMQSLL